MHHQDMGQNEEQAPKATFIRKQIFCPHKHVKFNYLNVKYIYLNVKLYIYYFNLLLKD